MAISKKGITLFYAEKGAANIENTTFAARLFNIRSMKSLS